jgi:hypothetical protein
MTDAQIVCDGCLKPIDDLGAMMELFAIWRGRATEFTLRFHDQDCFERWMDRR